MAIVLEWLKHIPLDLGQWTMGVRTKGKQIAMSLVPPGEGRTALDVGARDGNQTRWLRERGYDVTSIDVELRFPECQPVDVNQGLPFDDGAFDLIWCSEVIEHLEHPEQGLAEMRRVARPGADLLLTTPNSYAWFFRVASLFGLTPQKIQDKGHLHFFAEDDVRKLAPDAELYGFFPYAIYRGRIRRGISLLSPTFVLHLKKPH